MSAVRLLWLALRASTPAVAPHDPGEVPATLEPLDVARAVLANNPSLAAGRAAVQAAEAMVRSEGAFPEPMIEGRLAPLSLAAGPFVERADKDMPVGFEIMLSQPLPLTPRLAHAHEAARAEADSMASEERALRLELAERAAVLACDAWELQRALDVNAHHEELVSAMRSAARDAIAAGRGTIDEALRVDDEAVALEDEELAGATALDVVLARINALLHRPPDAPLPPPPEVLEPFEPAPSDRELHPLVEGADARVRAASARVDEVDSRNVPDVRLTASYSSMWPDVEHQLMVGVALEIPSARAARDASIDRARAERDAALRLADERRDLVAAEVRTARLRLDEARARAALFDRQRLPLAAERTSNAGTAFSVGTGSLLGALMALRDERHVVLEAHRARAEVCRREARLRAALGIDLSPSSPTSSRTP